jgi:aminopeptidase N
MGWVVHYRSTTTTSRSTSPRTSTFSDRLGDLPLDYYVLPEDLEKAKAQFSQVKPMLQAFEHYFGEYPFKEDGYKLVQVPYAGMEHQSAVAYGNRFVNSLLSVTRLDRRPDQSTLRLHHHS